jgi:hypothetical protein
MYIERSSHVIPSTLTYLHVVHLYNATVILLIAMFLQTLQVLQPCIVQVYT